ncbi:unnamed protein product [Echinostoma caproni]|uniref:Integrase catalytic domain-containing protein n=1 Tax=Echinostoma caproni TaxID=27848 RepID=A0A183BA92_9TREM|nr:unnamed protein product [Echinostoma caproni]
MSVALRRNWGGLLRATLGETKTSTEKRCECLMACLQSRALHIETVHSMSTDSVLMAWQRFVGRRSNPSNVFSDNGSNFVGAQKELSDWLMRLDKRALQDRLSPSESIGTKNIDRIM